ncbi:MAG: YbjN domain-containing protein [Verrucomicrobiaceae bacterium]|nr:YbjN domain-containing protein [Verrucomicrobiaceae bacterium]
MTVKQTLISQIEAAFDAAGWQYRKVEQQPVIECEFEAYNAKVAMHLQAFEELSTASVMAQLSFRIPPASRLPVWDALMRTNLTLNVGNFEANIETGEVFFRISNVFAKGLVDDEIITSLVRTAIVEMDRITPFLAELNRQPQQPIDALLAREDLLPPIGEESTT